MNNYELPADEPDEEQLFAVARKIEDRAARASFLAVECRDRGELVGRVRALLTIHETDKTFLETPLAFPASFTAAEACGTQIGAFTLIRQIGAGGMGVVWLARQEQPVQRNVALKLVSPLHDSPDLRQRFESERQALALMQHPAIPKLLDAGATEDGRPWFAMELVDGTPLVKHCAARNDDVRERLRLFLDVCDAVHHLHQAGVIHCDLKPGNILVTEIDGAAQVRVIDFGAAIWIKDASSGRNPDRPEFFPVGTPAYMSPEQATPGNLELSVASDIYSLGVLLYELLTSVTPFESPAWRAAEAAERCRIVRQEPVSAPSRKRAELGLSSEQGLQSNIPADLDSLVLRALQKSPAGRYPSVKALAADVQRFLTHQCVEAHPRTLLYQWQMLWQRRRLRIAAGAIAMAGLVLLTLLGRDTLQKRRELEQQRQTVLVAEARLESEREHQRMQRYVGTIKAAFAALDRGNVAFARRRLETLPSVVSGREQMGFEYGWLKRLSHDGLGVESTLRIPGRPFHVVWSPDGRLLAACSGGKISRRVQVWDAATGAVVLSLGAFFSDVNWLCFSADGQSLATAEEIGQVRFWNIADGAELRRFSDFGRPVAQIALSADMTRLIATRIDWRTLDADTFVLNFADGTRVAELPGARLLDFDEATSQLAVWKKQDGRHDGTVSLLAWPKLAAEIDLAGRQAEVICGAFSPNGRSFAAGTRDGKVLFWPDRTAERRLLAVPYSAAVRDVEFHASGTMLAAALSDGKTWVRDVDHPDAVFVADDHLGPCWSLEGSPDGTRLAVACDDSTVRIRSWKSTASVTRTLLRVDCAEDLEQASLTPDGRSLVHLRPADSSVRLISIAKPGDERRILLRNASDVRFQNCVLTPDARSLVLTDLDGRLFLADAASGECRFVSETYGTRVMRPILSNDGRFVALNSHSVPPSRSGLWDLQSGREVFSTPELQTGLANIQRISAFLDSSNVLFNQATQAAVWDWRAGKPAVPRYSFNSSWIFGTAVSRDGTSVAIYTEDKTISLWDVRTNAIQTILQSHDSFVGSLAYSPDGRLLATGAENGMVQLWHLPTAQLLTELSGLTGRVDLLKFSDDDQQLTAVAATQTGRGEAVVWDTVLQ